MSEQEIEQIQLSLDAAQEKINLMEALTRLEDNKDFQLVFGQNYLDEFPARLVRLRASYTMQRDPAQLAYIDNQLNAIGFLANFIQFVNQEGREAMQAIEADREELSRIEEEDS